MNNQNSNSVPFNYNDIPAENLISWKQMARFIANPATDYLFYQIGARRVIGSAANAIIYNQMKSAIWKVTTKEGTPLTNGVMRKMGAILAKNNDVMPVIAATKIYTEMFNLAIQNIKCSSAELEKRLLKDGVKSSDVTKIVLEFHLLTDNEVEVDADVLEKLRDADKIIEAKAKAKPKAKAKAKAITARVKMKTPASRTIEVQTRASLTADQRADAIVMLQQRLDELIAM